MMRILFSSFSFVMTVIIGAVAFAFTAIEFPGIMRELIARAQTLPAYLSSAGLSDTYMVWVDILLSGDKLVLLGFVMAARIVVAILSSVVSPLFEGSSSSRNARYMQQQQQQSQGSAFNGWGNSAS
jgi:hypothetical protein